MSETIWDLLHDAVEEEQGEPVVVSDTVEIGEVLVKVYTY
jgi:hypothetical protein